MSGEQISFPGFPAITVHFKPRPGSLASMLGHGAAAAITTGELAAEMGASDPRAVTIAVYRERRSGSPICSGQNGFFLPLSDAEVRDCVRGMRHRAKEIEESADALEQAWNVAQEVAERDKGEN